mgnify:CR=1 FL=1
MNNKNTTSKKTRQQKMSGARIREAQKRPGLFRNFLNKNLSSGISGKTRRALPLYLLGNIRARRIRPQIAGRIRPGRRPGRPQTQVQAQSQVPVRVNNSPNRISVSPARITQTTPVIPVSTKYAVIIGNQYNNTLPGCFADADMIQKLLIKFHGYKSGDILLLRDANYVTTLAALNILVTKANQGKNELFFFYSGHGSFLKDNDGDESSGNDQCIVPVDYKSKGLVTDDKIHEIFLKLPSNIKLRCVFDCCYSASILDLQFKMHNDGLFANETPRNALYADVVCLSACGDSETAASAYNLDRNNRWQGALTVFFNDIITSGNGDATLKNLVDFIGNKLSANSLNQTTTIYSSRPATSVFF